MLSLGKFLVQTPENLHKKIEIGEEPVSKLFRRKTRKSIHEHPYDSDKDLASFVGYVH